MYRSISGGVVPSKSASLTEDTVTYLGSFVAEIIALWTRWNSVSLSIQFTSFYPHFINKP